jgi:hypothetical protein
MPKVKPKKIKDSGLSKQIRRLGVLAEDTNRKVNLVSEQYGDIKKTLNKHSAKLDSHTEMIGNIAKEIQKYFRNY